MQQQKYNYSKEANIRVKALQPETTKKWLDFLSKLRKY